MIKANINTQAVLTMFTITILTCAFLPACLINIRVNREMMLGVVIILLSGVAIYRYTLAGAILAIYTAIHLYFTKSPYIEHHIFLLSCVSVLACAGLYSYRHWAGAKEYVINLVCVIAIANVIIASLQVLGVHIPVKIYGNSAVGFMTNPNELSSLLAVCLPLFYRKRWWYLIPVLLAGMILSRSLQGVAVAAVVSFIFIWYKWGRKIALAGLIPVLLSVWGFIAFADYDGFDLKSHMDMRGKTWQVTTMAGTEKPVFGWGWGQYGVVIPLLTGPAVMGEQWTMTAFPKITDMPAFDNVLTRVTGTDDIEKVKDFLYNKQNNTAAVMFHAHNEYIEMFFTFGLAGVLLMAAFIWVTIRKGWTKENILITLAFISMCLCAALFFVWQLIPFIALTALFIAIIHGTKGISE